MDNFTFRFGKHKDHKFEDVYEDKEYTAWVHKVVAEATPEKQNKCFVSYVKYCKKRDAE